MTGTQRRRLQYVQELMTLAQGTAADIVNRGEEHKSILMTLRGDVEVGIEPLLVPEGLALNDVLRRLLVAARAWGYVYINEAWVTTAVGRVARGEVAAVLELPPDDREEQVIITGVVQGLPPRLLAARVEATPSGRALGGWQVLQAATFLGDAGLVLDW